MLDAYAEPIAAAYDLGPVLEFTGPVARGEQGEVWRLRTDRGQWAVKRSFAAFAEVDARRAGEFQNLARQHGVPAPLAVTTPDGRFGHPLGDTLVRVQSWADVLDPDPLTDPARVGTVIAALHRTVRPVDDGPDPWYTDGVGTDGWDAILAESRRQRAPFLDRLADLRAELVALEQLLTPMAEVQTCHLDLWADNLRPVPGGGLCLLDWDNCGPGDPSRELALVLFEFARTSPARLASLHAAYREAGGPGRVRTPADFSVLIAQLNHIGAMQLRHWLNPATSTADRSRALAAAGEFLDDPLTRSTVEVILDAVT